MHLTALVDHPEHVCCRYRLAAFRPLFESAGHTLELRSLPRRWWNRLRLFHELRNANVILQRHLLPTWQLSFLRRRVSRLLFDFDDAIFLRDSYSPRGLHHTGRLRRFAATVRACDAVLAGNSFLRARAQTFADKSCVHLIPTCVDADRYPLADSESKKGKVDLIWVGSSSTLQGLERCAALLEEIGERIPELRLKLVCDRFLTLRNLPVVPISWTEENEVTDIASADIGISHVPDDDWSRGKCGLKVLQYMAAGLPVVANPVGVHIEMVRHGETGFLAETPDEWVRAISQLASDSVLRRRMGRAGRYEVETRYNVATGARRWLTVLDSLQALPARTA